MKKLYVSLLAGITLLYACKKDNEEPSNTNGPAQKLQKDIQGKWDFDTDFGIGGRKTTSTNGRKSLFGHPLGIKDVTTNGTSDTQGYEAGFIEFGADSTYILFDGYGQVFTGKYLAHTTDSISLSNFGSLGGITLTSGALAFRLHYTASNKTLTVASTKVQPIATDSRTTILSKSVWKITAEGSGAEILGSEEWEYNDENGQPHYYTVDSATYQASINGTYLVQYFSKGVVKEAFMARWKWHETNPNIFYYSHDNDDWDSDNFVTITELTVQRLKIEETYDSDGNGQDDTKDTWVLVPAK